ncbi:HAD-IIIA family hydrolase [Candidatus Woesearchaeota archaeon]|nr:HAD-IIIA family hydrolase [Candidatus Woesearchaeota archaeon]
MKGQFIANKYLNFLIYLSSMDIYPRYTFKDVTEIDPKVLEGKKLLIFDIDNTLFYSETIKIRKDILHWFKGVKKKHRVVCFSNSFSIRKRRPMIEYTLGCEVYLSTERKPSKKLFKEITKRYRVSAKDVAVIGDFHFTDVLFANRNKATSILVRPIGGDHKLILRIARVLENVVLFLLELVSPLLGKH